ncbi:Acyl-synthetase, LuxE family protein [Clostridiaceae bacterium BL-3]|nr:Acyl-synthetase, LuxE family protein [Clostridiaceae bacterium BL-3]
MKKGIFIMSEKKYWDNKIETLPQSEIKKLQEKRLKEILNFAYTNSAYYKKSFNTADVKPSDFKILSDINRFPFINKQIERKRQLKKPILGDIDAVSEKDVVYVSASSGSTGIPTLSPFTKQDFDEFQNIESRLFYAAGVRKSDRYVHALNFSLHIGGPDVIGAQNLGALCIWAGTIPSEKLLFILKEFQPTVIWTTPAYAWYLGEAAKKHGIDPAKDLAVNKIIVGGEPGGSIRETREAVEKLWNAKFYDFYGLSDLFGAFAGMCEVRNGLHVAEDYVLVEILDPKTNKPVPDGGQGEIVLTTLRKRARPMIRFRTGDIGTINHTPCICGRTHARINITGRIDDMFIVSGVNVFPSDIEAVVRGIPEVTGEYVIHVLKENFATKYKVEIEKVANSDKTDEQVKTKVSDALKIRLGVRPKEVIVLRDGTIPRTTHKAKRFIDERK